jgi:putative tryptophan/tyrosine transport system substrate-binding protein
MRPISKAWDLAHRPIPSREDEVPSATSLVGHKRRTAARRPLREVDAAAGGQKILVLEMATGREIDAAFEKIADEKPDAVFVAPGSFFNARRVKLAILSARYALPAIYPTRAYPEVGGLLSYGTDILDAFRQVGVYAARILKGAKPAELPVLQSTKFELVINLNTSRALGLDVPSKLLAVANEVIE